MQSMENQARQFHFQLLPLEPELSAMINVHILDMYIRPLSNGAHGNGIRMRSSRQLRVPHGDSMTRVVGELNPNRSNPGYKVYTTYAT